MKEEEAKFGAFPYKPYSIQIDFMNALYDYLDKGGVSILESPTGTGKTLSIICSALQWLLDQREKQKFVAIDNSLGGGNDDDDDDEPDWMREFVVKVDKTEPKKRISIKTKKEKKKNKPVLGVCNKGGMNTLCQDSTISNDGIDQNDDDDEFLLEDYETEDEEGVILSAGKTKRKANGVSIPSSSDEESELDGSDEEEEKRLKVYFCSRTHSQLSQFIKELRKTAFTKEILAVCLGSRKIFCINEEVLRLGSSTRINERCLELQKNKKKNDVSKIKNLGTEKRVRQTKASSCCPMLRKHKLQREFKEEMSQQDALDIEDLVALGKSMGTCPYYGSRSMLPKADLVVLPYQSLLSKSSREALGLDLKNNIVIIDEAHNLADSLIRMYDAKITLLQLQHVHSHIQKYFARFRSLLGPGNRRYIQTLMVLTRAFLQSLQNEEGCATALKIAENGAKSASDFSMAINDFLFSLNIDNINLIKLVQYIKQSNIIHKVNGYGDKVASLQKGSEFNDKGQISEEGSTLSGFRALADMLMALTNNDGDGRVIISRKRPTSSGQQEGYLKYVMLTGEKVFSEIADEAHAVILAGGTMQPIEETRERLFPWLASEKLQFFSCGHIVPRESILPVAVTRGPSGQTFDFSYSSRSSPIMIEELGRLLCNLATVVPEGIVVFFSSFEYEGQVYDTWSTSGVLERIMKKKHIFREPRKNTDVDHVLQKYKMAIDTLSSGSTSQTGAILLAVVGGKISEGINFSDGMGRCIVMVGLPYPSPSDIELLERIKHIEALGLQNSAKGNKILFDGVSCDGNVETGFNILRSCKHRGKEYYENLCMKAVNQSIGRAIRHINDYAAILLVDNRYGFDPSKRSAAHPSCKLPQWIKDSLIPTTNNYGEVHRLLHQFFKTNKIRAST
ncbi:hypothetical protein ACFE04_008524 [Oxalis oulophora]